MRSAITISLPESVLKDLRKEVKKGKFTSMSEYIRHIVREQATLRLAKELKAQTREFEKGKWKVLKNLSELDT